MTTPATDLDLVNTALANLGHTVYVTDLTNDTTVEAKAARLMLDGDRDQALGILAGPGAGWKWAQRRQVLTALAGQTHERWTQFYTPPTDWVPGTGWFYMGHPNPNPDAYPEWEAVMTAAGTGRCIACNMEPLGSPQTDPVFIYTARITNVALYPQAFVNYLCWMLAADLAMPVTRDRKLRESAIKETELALRDAIRSELAGMQTYQPPPTPSIRARR
jgi:hypothetical protein